MPDRNRTTIRITFAPPSRDHQAAESARHERRLDDVPVAVADQMMADLQRYRETQQERSPLYRYERDGEEVVLALDLEEVVALVRPEAAANEARVAAR
ncbi:MAG: hypothetical protein ABEL97_04890 [Salinibacter sp.]